MININLVLIFILFIIYINIKKVYIDLFTNIKLNNITYYVIHMKNSNENKYNNILNIEKQLNQKINIFDAIIGKNINLKYLNMFDENIKFNFNYTYRGEVGCYLSHLMLIKQASTNTINDYTVIFEDDFKIKNDNLIEEINNIINKTNGDFDMIYLGNLNNNHNKQIIDNIYTIDSEAPLWGTHALLINNKNANKILSNITNIDSAIDNKYKNIIDNNSIKAYVIYPTLVEQNTDDFKSEIRPNAYKQN
jgi:GR25 family glycosyltransferase involved in LPS biosynthesis